ncbi:MAG: N-acetylglucosamine-6-phosphate deacetylase [Acidobacteriota bacterium]
MKWLVANGNLVTRDSILENTNLIINDDKIEAIEKESNLTDFDEVLDVKDCYVLPGFIDLHCHGGYGSDVMDGTPEAIATVGRFHAQGGTAYFLATTASDSLENLQNVFQILRSNKDAMGDGAKPLGAHLEGPYFARKKHGCHLPEYIRNPSESETSSLLEYSDVIKSITVAPEIPGALKLIKRFSENSIVVSLGHTECSYDEALSAVEMGARHVTHLYCAMSGIIKNGVGRKGGLIETALLEDRLTAEIIADGIHVPTELIRLAVKAKGMDKICVVTDAMRGAGMKDGIYTFGSPKGQEAIVKDKMAVVKEGTGLASSVFKMNEMFCHMSQNLGYSYTDLARMFSYNPACVLSMQDKIGSIEPGKMASFTILNRDHEVEATIVEGKAVYLKNRGM